METLQLTFGTGMDALAFAAIFIYMPIANYFIRKHEQKMEPDAFDTEWHECDM